MGADTRVVRYFGARCRRRVNQRQGRPRQPIPPNVLEIVIRAEHGVFLPGQGERPQFLRPQCENTFANLKAIFVLLVGLPIDRRGVLRDTLPDLPQFTQRSAVLENPQRAARIRLDVDYTAPEQLAGAFVESHDGPSAEHEWLRARFGGRSGELDRGSSPARLLPDSYHHVPAGDTWKHGQCAE